MLNVVSCEVNNYCAIYKLSLTKVLFQEGNEGERGGGVGSGNPFGDDNEEEEVGPHSVISKSIASCGC